MRPLRPPFTLSQQFPKTAISAYFSSLSPLFQQKLTKFAVLEPKLTQNFRSKASNLAKIQFFMPYVFKNQFFKPLFLVPTHSLGPLFRPFEPHTYTKMKVEYPPEFLISVSCVIQQRGSP